MVIKQEMELTNINNDKYNNNNYNNTVSKSFKDDLCDSSCQQERVLPTIYITNNNNNDNKVDIEKKEKKKVIKMIYDFSFHCYF